MHKIIISGIKHSGKSTIGWRLSSKLGIFFADLDDLILKDNRQYRTIRDLYRDLGADGFKEREFKSLKHFLKTNNHHPFVLSLGGGTIENAQALELLKSDVTTYFLDAKCDDLFSRIIKGGIPPFIEGDDPYQNFVEMYDRRTSLYKSWCQIKIDTENLNPEEITAKIEALVNS